MDTAVKSSIKDFKDRLNFINISSEVMTIYEWKPPNSFKNYSLDLKIVKDYAMEDIFFHIYKGNSKIVHIKKGTLIYTVGAKNDVQFQLLEALLEKISEEFSIMYDVDVILSFENVSTNVFKNFNSILDEILNNYENLNLVKKLNAYCRVCKTVLPIYVKKSFIKNSEDFPVPLVYSHKGHAVLIFIDQNFDVRGVELVNMSG